MYSIEELEQLIKTYSIAYYKGEPIVDDATFDSLVDTLREMNSQSSVLKTGWGFEVQGNKLKHKYVHIGSLDKAKSYEEFPSRFKNQNQVYISPKLDGLSAVAYYEQGYLVKGITRGNGEYGKDITDKLRRILGTTIKDSEFTGAVRGELIISDENWKRLQLKYTDLISPRNYAAGIINRNEIDDDIQYIDLVVYKIVGQENKPCDLTREGMISWLNNNFQHSIPSCYLPNLNMDSWKMYHESIFESFRNNLGYGLDGLVLTSNTATFDTETQGILWDEFAFKFKSESTTTIIKEIEWTLSRTNRLVPVAVVEPVELSGAIIQRATCNNAQMVKDLGIGAGSEIDITRSNEVIPLIQNVINPTFEPLPEYCPMCQEKLKWVGVDLKCTNENCINVKLSDLQQWCEVIGETEGLQWTLMKQYLDMFNIKSIDQLYAYKQQIITHFSQSNLSITDMKAKEFFTKLFIEPIPSDKFLLGLNIPRLGEKTTQLLASEKGIILDLISYFRFSVGEYDKLKAKLLPIVKESTTQAILDNGKKFLVSQYIVNDSAYNIIFPESIDKSNIQYIAITGALQSMSRKEFESFIQKYNYQLSTNLKKCKYLVNNDVNSTSSKNKQAKELNVPIISEQEFFDSLK